MPYQRALQKLSINTQNQLHECNSSPTCRNFSNMLAPQAHPPTHMYITFNIIHTVRPKFLQNFAWRRG